MTPEAKKILAGSIAGALSAFVIDLDAWAKVRQSQDATAKFDWFLAASRWLRGAIIGGATGAGISL